MSLAVDLTVRRRHLEVAVELVVGDGERLSLFGPSGAGKTTVLEAVCGLVAGVQGELWCDAVRLGSIEAAREAGISVVRQPTSLFWHLSVADNVTYGLPRPDRPARERLLDEVGLGGQAAASPLRLSGGQRQRVAFARAIARPFRALLLDEPFSAVDGPGRAVLREIAEREIAAAGAAGILVSHDLGEAQAFGDRLAVMDAGSVLQAGPPDEVVRQPCSERVAELVGYTAFVDGGGGFDPGDGWSVAVHPDRVLFGERPGCGVVARGQVVSSRPSGARYVVELDCPELRIRQAGDTGSRACPPRRHTLQVHVDSQAPPAGSDLAVTLLAPPRVASLPVGGSKEGSGSA